MTFWAMPYRSETVDRDATYYWRDMEDDQGEGSNDLFGQYVDFDADAAVTTSTAGHGSNPPMSTLQDSLLFDQPHDGTGSSGVSTADDFDFLSNSSQAGPTTSSVSHDVDPTSLAVKAEHHMANSQHYEIIEHAGGCPVSDTELPSLEAINLHSPRKDAPITVSPHRFPSPPSAVTERKPNKFVEALSSTIRKATGIRKSRKPLPVQPARAASPTLHNPPRALQQRTSRIGVASSGMPVSPPDTGFIHGYCDDPFTDGPPPSQTSPMRYYSQNGLSTPVDTPALGIARSESADLSAHIPVSSWPLQQIPLAPASDHWSGHDFTAGQETGWWDLNLLNQQGNFEDPKHAGVNMAMHAHYAGLPYEYTPITDPSTAGLMIHMPLPRPPQPTVVSDIAVTAQTYLPPPPPIPATERPHRPPRAPSSGARHRNLSSSPMRKTRAPRAPSASPTPARSRHSSGGSISSVRSASGRLPASMPGTPCSVRKRRPRESSSSGDTGFVNFTPNDGSILMTGVAPSGSSKTKARREKELQEKNRKLSEAAMKIVAAAGGDVDKLAEHGFAF